MNKQIVPAILESSKQAIESKISRVSKLTDIVQIDITDGRFVPSKTYGSSGRESSCKSIRDIARSHKIDLVIDLMVDLDCGDCMDRWVRALMAIKPKRVIFHLGSTYRWDELFYKLELEGRGSLPFECGLAVRIDHTRREIAKTFEEHPFAYLQVMGIEKVGYSGQKFAEETYDRIKKLRRKYSDVPIAVDGGIKLQHAEKLFESGATRLGVNSGLFKTGNLQDAWNKFNVLIS